MNLQLKCFSSRIVIHGDNVSTKSNDPIKIVLSHLLEIFGFSYRSIEDFPIIKIFNRQKVLMYLCYYSVFFTTNDTILVVATDK